MALSGAKEIKASFKAIRSGNHNAARAAAFAGARYLRTAERQASPRASGKSVNKIIARRRRGTAAGEGVATVEVTRAGFYLHILEVGAKRHRIGLKSVHSVIHPVSRETVGYETGRRALAIGKGFGKGHGLLVFRRAVLHPGTRASHWFRNTYERERPRIMAEIQKSYAGYIAKTRKKKGA